MNLNRYSTQNVFLFCIIVSLCIYYAYQYFRIEELIENIDDEFEKEMRAVNVDQETEPKPLAISVEKHLLFQPNIAKEFPTDKFATAKIPHIIHTIFRNTSIPYGFANNVRSFYRNNIDWEFRFWTFESGRKLIEKQHPYLLNTFDSWTRGADDDEKRSNMLRYVILYEYGGFSADLDIDNYRPLDVATKKYGCIVPPLPFEHSVLLYNFDVILTSSVMLCRPKHPFFKLVLETMSKFDSKLSTFDASGDGHITRVYMEYNNINVTTIRKKKKTDDRTNSPYFYKGERDEDDEDSVYVPNTQYFLDTVNAHLTNKRGGLKECSDHDSLKSYLTTRACAEFESRKELRYNREYLFTYKLWHVIWGKQYTTRVIPIKKIIPKVILDN